MTASHSPAHRGSSREDDRVIPWPTGPAASAKIARRPSGAGPFSAFFRRIAAVLAAVLAVGMVQVPMSTTAFAADQAFPTVQILRTTSAAGFVHPGISVSADDLENAREQVRGGVEPWASYYAAMTATKYSSTTFSSMNLGSSPDTPANPVFNSQAVQALFIDDAFRAYTQAIQYVVTGDPVYRANALKLIRIWSHMDPTAYAYYPDAHIHSGVPLMRMLAAAEILRYTSINPGTDGYELAWRDVDTQDITNNLINPMVKTFLFSNTRFMNQHVYGLVGRTAGTIFTDDAAGYRTAVEWFTLNSSNPDRYADGGLDSLIRVINRGDPLNTFGKKFVQVQEMGRDQAHAWDDIAKLSEMARILTVQNTKLDPKAGTLSTRPNAVSPYRWGNDRLLAGADAFYAYMMGQSIPWIDTSNRNGVVSEAYRGRMYSPIDELYEIYKYRLGVDVERSAPNVARVAAQADGPIFYWGTASYNFWNSNPDYNVDYWLAIPGELAGKKRPTQQTADVQLETRSIPMDRKSEVRTEGDRTFVQTKGRTSTIAVRTMLYDSRTSYSPVGVLVRTNGAATLKIAKAQDLPPYQTVTLPDTRGQWRYVTYDMSFQAVPGARGGENLAYYTVEAPRAVTVDLDSVNPQAKSLTPPIFPQGSSVSLIAVAGEAQTRSLAATDSGSPTLSYETGKLPAGATVDSATGQLTWTPTKRQIGVTESLLVASDGTTLASLKLSLNVVSDRQAAISAALQGYDPGASHVAATVSAVEQARQAAEAAKDSPDTGAFQAAVVALQQAVAKLQPLNPRLDDGTLDFSTIVTTSLSSNILDRLVDKDFNTYSGDLRAPFTFDFGAGFRVKASAFGLQARYNFGNRTQGANVYGSNDGQAWTLLTSRETTDTGAQGFAMETIPVRPEVADSTFRFVKVQVDTPGIPTDPSYPGLSSFSEFRITGDRLETARSISSVHISSSGADPAKAVNGDTVTLDVVAAEPLGSMTMTIEGRPVTVTGAGTTWQGSLTLPPDVAYGRAARFTVDYTTALGVIGTTVSSTTDGSAVDLWNSGVQTIDVAREWVDASTGRGTVSSKDLGWRMFDGDLSTATDTTTNNGWVTVTPPAGAPLEIDSVMMRARTGFAGRASGTKVQTSTDGQNWTTVLTFPTITTDTDWYVFDLPQHVSTERLRILDDHGGWTNVAEIKLVKRIT